MLNIFLEISFSVLIFLGVLMVFIPVLPALFYMFALTLIFSVIGGFSVISIPQLIILGGILLLGFANDLFSGILGAKWSGASKKSIIYGFIGLLVGTIVLPPFGGIAGLFVGVLIAELMLGKTNVKALKSATGSLIGAITGIAINLILAITFFILFLIFLIF